ncbi:MAG: 50S ribosomal protein L11 methyltransferase [Desulfosoma sp.]
MAQDCPKVKRSPNPSPASSLDTQDNPPDRLYVLECLEKHGRIVDILCEGLMGCWREPPYVYCFFDRVPSDLAISHLEAKGFHVTGRYDLSYGQWQRLPNQLLHIGPFQILFTSQDTHNLPLHALSIVLRPGLVFGSGMHPTTRLCLKLLAQVYVSESMRTVVDVGTGTGILAMAAARLGARRVLALDVNPLAVEEAGANVRRNGLDQKILLVIAAGLEAVGPFGELLLVNLEWPSLRVFLQKDGWKRFRWIICSGYFESQAETLKSMFLGTHSPEGYLVQEDWAASFWRRT